MLLNATTAISTSSVLLVPYSKRHVLKYHEWMKDEEIQQATASEPLTLSEEYAMQQSWRRDADKLTFIACLPLPLPLSSPPPSAADTLSVAEGDDAPERMIGDTNLFLRFDDDDDDDDDDGTDTSEGGRVIGEIELMIAEKRNQGQGFGRGALLTFLWYIVNHEGEILDEFLQSTAPAEEGSKERRKMKCLSVKIGKSNARSLALFESLGFERKSPEPNYFGEFELRRYGLDRDAVVKLVDTYGLKDYRELNYKGE